MILKQLRLTNFRQYENLELPVPDGITSITGPNGSGKSTLLEAVLWCLFGNRAARTSKEGIKRQAARESDACEVSLDFELAGTAYTLTRSLIGKSGRPEAQLTQQGRLNAVTTREVDDYVVRLIGLDLKGFLSSFFARQKELSVLSDARPADRKDHLAKMLGVGRLDDAIVLLKEDIKSTRQQIDVLDSRQIDPVQLQEKLTQKESEISGLEKQQTTVKGSLDSIEQQAGSLNQEDEQLRRKEQQYHELEKEKSGLTAQKKAKEEEIVQKKAEQQELNRVADTLGSLQKQIEGLEALRESVDKMRQDEILSREKSRLDGELLQTKERRKNLSRDRLVLLRRIAQLDKETSESRQLTADLEEAEKLREKLRSQYNEVKSDITLVGSSLEKVRKQKKEIEKLGPDATCEFCLRRFGDDYGSIEKHFAQEALSLEHRLDPLQKKLREIEKEGTVLADQIARAKRQLEQINKLEQELASLRAQLAAIERGAVETDGRRAELEKRLTEMGAVVFDAEKLRRSEEGLKQKQALREEYVRREQQVVRRQEIGLALKKGESDLLAVENGLKDTRTKMAQLGFDQAEYERTKTELTEVREKVTSARLELGRLESGLLVARAESAVWRQKLDEYEASKKEISALRESLTGLERLQLLFGSFRVYLIGRIRPALSKHTSELFREMTDGRYQEVELDEDYSLCLYDDGEKFPVDRFSGGEIDLVNLCFRLAISLEMATSAGIDHSFIILDEIFGSQDIERQRLIMEGLSHLKSRFRQIIIISHIDDVKEMAEHVISVERDNTGVSRAVLQEVA